MTIYVQLNRNRDAELENEYFNVYEGDEYAQSPFSITIVPGRISAQDCVATGDALLLRTAGQEGAISIAVSDAFANAISPSTGQRAGFNVAVVDIIDISILYQAEVTPEDDGTLTATYTIERAAQYRVNILYVGEQIICDDEVCPSPLVVEPDRITAAQCGAEGEGTTDAGAGLTASLIVSIRDQFGNLRSAGNDTVVSTLQVSGSEFTLDPTDLGDGTYSIEYVTTVAGQAVLSIQAWMEADSANVDISGSPFTVTVQYGTPVAAAMTASGEGLTDGVAGAEKEAALRAYDAYNNVVQVGGDVVMVTFYNAELDLTVSSASRDEAERGIAQVEDHKNGRYTVTWTLNPSGTYVMSATLNGEIITAIALTNQDDPDSTRQVFINYAATDVCFVAGDGIGDGTAGVPVTFSLQSMDAFGNRRLEDSDTIVVSRGSTENEISVETVYAQDGLYSVTYTQGTEPEDGQGAGQLSLIIRAGPDADNLMGTRTADNTQFSPFQLVIEPGTVTADSVRVRTSDGGLYASNAGQTATFGIIAEDIYGAPP